jgi:hypothetical protein
LKNVKIGEDKRAGDNGDQQGRKNRPADKGKNNSDNGRE